MPAVRLEGSGVAAAELVDAAVRVGFVVAALAVAETGIHCELHYWVLYQSWSRCAGLCLMRKPFAALEQLQVAQLQFLLHPLVPRLQLGVHRSAASCA